MFEKQAKSYAFGGCLWRLKADENLLGNRDIIGVKDDLKMVCAIFCC